MNNFIEIEDKELEEIEDDFFENKKYVKLLENKIKSNNKFNVLGLYGEWGRGKTSIVKATEKNILAENGNYIFIKYDAWKYSGNSFKRMFLMEIAKVVDVKNNNSKKINELNRKFYNTQSEARGKEYVFYGAFVCLVIFLSLSLYILLGKKEFEVGISLTILGVLSTIEWVFKILKYTSGTITNTITEHPMVNPEEFEKCFKEMIEEFIEKKIVIVIDNLDRCSSTEAYEALSSIKCFFNEKNNLMYIIPIDELAIKKHIKKQFNNDDVEASQYIMKIINSSIYLESPSFIKNYKYIDWLCKENKIDFPKKLKLVIAEMKLNNPRKIINFINNLCNELNLYPEEKVKSKEHLVAIVLFLKDNFSESYYNLKDGSRPSDDLEKIKNYPKRLNKYFPSNNIKDLIYFANKTEKIVPYYIQDFYGEIHKNELKNDELEYSEIENLEMLSETIEGFAETHGDIAIECIEKMIEIIMKLDNKNFYYEGIYDLLSEIDKYDNSSEMGTPLIGVVFEKINNKDEFVNYAYQNYIKGNEEVLELIVQGINLNKNSSMRRVFEENIKEKEILDKIKKRDKNL